VIQLDWTYLALCVAGVASWWATPKRHRALTGTVFGAGFLLALDPAAALMVGLATAWLSGTRHALAAWGLLAAFVALRIAALDGFGGLVTPLGFGFTLCRLGHYAIERQRGTLRAHTTLELAAYAFFFPVQVIGPIQRFDTFLRDLRRHRWDLALFDEGLERILYGYAKVTVGANYLIGVLLKGQLVLWLGSRASAATVLGDCVTHGLALYLAFAGMSDIAIGLGRLMGQRLPENFDYPYLQPDLARFWERWHATLSSWCRDYVFLPVLARTRMRAVGLVTSMVVLGSLWHEFTWRYLLWGAWHGLGLAALRTWRDTVGARLPEPTTAVGRGASYVAGMTLTAAFVLSSFVFTKNDHLDDVWRDLRLLLGG
jgi:alginate O-acetyltransferase complex protein AlgI